MHNHAAHNAATAVEGDYAAQAAARAAGHAAATVHVETHAFRFSVLWAYSICLRFRLQRDK
ncbi:putative immunity protein [Desulforamulus ruminis]|uniref:putative immunity protein n=1 Tax=Desulforamulus ruminis TaxID=1564 RepID=UPI003B00EC42